MKGGVIMEIQGLNGKIEIYTMDEAPKVLNMGKRKLIDEVSKGHIKPYKFGNKNLFTDKIIKEYYNSKRHQEFLKIYKKKEV